MALAVGSGNLGCKGSRLLVPVKIQRSAIPAEHDTLLGNGAIHIIGNHSGHCAPLQLYGNSRRGGVAELLVRSG